MKKAAKQPTSGWDIFRKVWNITGFVLSALMTFIVLIFLFGIIGAFVSTDSLETGNVAVIPLIGPITTDGELQFERVSKSQDIVDLLEEADKDEEIKAIIVEIDSPGGTPVASDEIAQAVKRVEKPIISVIRETGASGAYWIASATDKIYANRMSITGSIGVTASGFDLSGLMHDFNVSYRRMVAGNLKDAGTPFRPLTKEEEKLFQNILDSLHDEFISTVAANRNLDVDYVRNLSTGFVFLGKDAYELKLVDELGSMDDALTYLEEDLNITAETKTLRKEKTLADVLAELASEPFYQMGRGMSSKLPASEISFT